VSMREKPDLYTIGTGAGGGLGPTGTD
jgi:hypothetical protein